MVDDTLPAAATIQLHLCQYRHSSTTLKMSLAPPRTHPVGGVTGCRRAVVGAAKPVRQQEVDGLCAPFCWRQGVNSAAEKSQGENGRKLHCRGCV